MCIVSVHSDFGGFPEASDAGLRIGFVLHIRILASRPPVAILEPSGWTCTENIDNRFGFGSLLDESLCITHAGFVKCIVFGVKVRVKTVSVGVLEVDGGGCRQRSREWRN